MVRAWDHVSTVTATPRVRAKRQKPGWIRFSGCPALMLEDSGVAQLAAPFALTLLSGSFHVDLLDLRHVAIQLSNDLDYSLIFSRRSYYIQSCQMRLLKWTPDFDVHHESPIVPIWVSFPNLRMHFFNSQILFGLASILGRPLQTDQATGSVPRPSVARVLVEVDISKKYPNEIWLGSEVNGYFQNVEFENFPIFCSHCKMHGHSLIECIKLHPHLKKDKKSVRLTKLQGGNKKTDGNDNLVVGIDKSSTAQDVADEPVFQVVPSSFGNEPNVDVGEGKNSLNEVIKVADHSSSCIVYESLQNVTQVVVVEDNNIIDVNTNNIIENDQVISAQGEVLALLVNSPIAHNVTETNLAHENVENMLEEEVVPS
ncbi:uncharacterized protein LOC114579511 [Dendrobium catenatum]|uniref:uncharacterized protein LOC114579511 n=1 Tax=Dendrobium catenatum TaxID=906689 RepID=UPI0010A00B04|nr:uncharacterized protein LOC114579511 [Dendrobium catenatum]